MENPVLDNDDVDAGWEKIEHNILNAAKESLGIRKINVNNVKNPIKDLANEKRKAHMQYCNNKNEANRTLYTTTKNRVNARIRELMEPIYQGYGERSVRNTERSMENGKSKKATNK